MDPGTVHLTSGCIRDEGNMNGVFIGQYQGCTGDRDGLKHMLALINNIILISGYYLITQLSIFKHLLFLFKALPNPTRQLTLPATVPVLQLG